MKEERLAHQRRERKQARAAEALRAAEKAALEESSSRITTASDRLATRSFWMPRVERTTHPSWEVPIRTPPTGTTRPSAVKPRQPSSTAYTRRLFETSEWLPGGSGGSKVSAHADIDFRFSLWDSDAGQPARKPGPSATMPEHSMADAAAQPHEREAAGEAAGAGEANEGGAPDEPWVEAGEEAAGAEAGNVAADELQDETAAVDDAAGADGDENQFSNGQPREQRSETGGIP